jgi:hypothetical protein
MNFFSSSGTMIAYKKGTVMRADSPYRIILAEDDASIRDHREQGSLPRGKAGPERLLRRSPAKTYRYRPLLEVIIDARQTNHLRQCQL